MLRSNSLLIGVSSFLLVPILAVIVACSDPAARPPPTGSTGSPGAPPPIGGGGAAAEGGARLDAGDAGDGGACNVFPNTGTLVDRVAFIGDPPVSTGGTVVDGLYDLTDYIVYVALGGISGPTGVTMKATLSVREGVVEQVTETGGGGAQPKVERKSSAFSVTGSTFATTELCPVSGASGSRQYTATGARLILTDPTLKEAFTFTLR